MVLIIRGCSFTLTLTLLRKIYIFRKTFEMVLVRLVAHQISSNIKIWIWNKHDLTLSGDLSGVMMAVIYILIWHVGGLLFKHVFFSSNNNDDFPLIKHFNNHISFYQKTKGGEFINRQLHIPDLSWFSAEKLGDYRVVGWSSKKRKYLQKNIKKHIHR